MKVTYVRRIPTVTYGYDEITLETEVKDNMKVDTLHDMMDMLNLFEKGEPVVAVEEIEKPKVKVQKSKAKVKIEDTPKVDISVDTEVEMEEEFVEEEETPVAPVAKKAKAPKVSPYDRTNELHKKIIGEILDDMFPKWRTAPAVAKAASVEMDGADFLDADGDVLDTFSKKFAICMKKKKS